MNDFLDLLSDGLINATVFISIAIVLILALRLIMLKIFGAKANYLLWSTPFIFLLFSAIELPGKTVEYLPFIGTLSKLSLSENTDINASADMLSNSSINESAQILPALSLFNWQPLMMTLWLSVSVVLLLRLSVSNMLFSRKLKQFPSQKTHNKYQIKILSCINNPAAWGIINPVILLPEDFDTRFNQKQQQLILQHESVHISRRDNLYNLLMTLLRITFWFNPLIYIAEHFFKMDQELSCDATVLQQANNEDLKQYALAMVASKDTEQGNNMTILSHWKMKSQILQRTKMLLKHSHRKSHFKTGALSLGLLAITLSVSASSTSDRDVVLLFNNVVFQGKAFINDKNMLLMDEETNSKTDILEHYRETGQFKQILFYDYHPLELTWSYEENDLPNRTNFSLALSENGQHQLQLTMSYSVYINYQEIESGTQMFLERDQQQVSIAFTDAGGQPANFDFSFEEVVNKVQFSDTFRY